MSDEADKLVRRIADMEAEIARLKAKPAMTAMMPVFRGKRVKSSITILGMPLYSFATGPDVEKGEMYGHAKGFLAIGDMATGVIAIGGYAQGLFAFGGMAIGILLAVGGCAIGTVALGGAAVGVLALGGGAAGYAAVGGGQAGYYACGGGAAGVHVIDPTQQDPAAVQFFTQWIPRLRALLRQPQGALAASVGRGVSPGRLPSTFVHQTCG